MIVRLVETARADLLDIWQYLARDNVGAVERQLDRLKSAIVRLGEFPEIGLARDDLRNGLRTLRIDRYAIFYCRRDQRLIVERILHASRHTESIRF